MRIYELTKEGKRSVKIPRPVREEILDHLYQFKTATSDELAAIDPDASSKLRRFKKLGYVREVTDGF